MKKLIGLTVTAICFAHLAPAFAQEEIPLWPGKAPGTESWTLPESVSQTPRGRIVANVSQPTLTVFLPDRAKATGTAVIFAPGGALRFLGLDDELIEWLRDQGIAAFVLKYRVLQAPPPAQSSGNAERPSAPGPRGFGGQSEISVAKLLETANANPSPDDRKMTEVLHMAVADAQQALRLVRKNAAQWNVKPDKVGFLGISAGRRRLSEFHHLVVRSCASGHRRAGACAAALHGRHSGSLERHKRAHRAVREMEAGGQTRGATHLRQVERSGRHGEDEYAGRQLEGSREELAGGAWVWRAVGE
jgi:hypothetical protein